MASVSQPSRYGESSTQYLTCKLARSERVSAVDMVITPYTCPSEADVSRKLKTKERMFYLPDPAPQARGMEDDARSGSKSLPLVVLLNISSRAAILIGSLGLEGKSNLVNTADSR